MIIDKSAFLKKSPRRYITVTTIKGDVRIQSMTEKERSELEDLFERSRKNHKLKMELKTRAILMSVVDEEGHLLLNETDIPAIQEDDSAFTAAIFDASLEHSGFSKDDREKLTAKN